MPKQRAAFYDIISDDKSIFFYYKGPCHSESTQLIDEVRLSCLMRKHKGTKHNIKAQVVS